MGTGGKSSGAQVTDYYMGMHYGICAGPVDALLSLWIGEKKVWDGPASAAGTFNINKRGIFGGDSQEGGVAGNLHYLPGDADQTLGDALAGKLGLTDATCPAFRGLASFFLTGTAAGGVGGGFLWGTNNPYLKPTWAEVQRIPDDWYPEKAAIVRTVTRTDTVNLNAVTNAATTDAGGLTAGVTLTGYKATDVLKLSLPSGKTFTAYSVWGTPSPANSTSHEGSQHAFRVIRNGDSGDVTVMGKPCNRLTNAGNYNGYEAARAAFPDGGESQISGGTSYTFYINDSPIDDNSGGLSIQVDCYGRVDANPAHIIVDALTNVDWGMGTPSSNLDLDSFTSAADTLYDEQFGLSMLWSEQATIDDLLKDVLDHINATLYVNPATGLLTLKLIRADYDVDTIPELDLSTCTITSFGRKGWGETVNEIVVSWTNPDNEETQTVTVQDLGNISMQGGVVSDSRNYYGIRRQDLAQTVAARDLTAASWPLATMEIEASRVAWTFTPGMVIKVADPEHDVEQIIMRVGQVDYGKPGDSRIKLSLVEDIFGLPLAQFVDSSPSSLHDPGTEDPAAIDHEIGTTLTYFHAFKLADVSAAEYPEVLGGVMAAQGGSDTLSFELLGPTVDAAGNETAYSDLGRRTILARATLTADLAAEASSSLTSAGFTGMTQGEGPVVGGFMRIGEAGDASDELCLLTAYDSGTDTWSISRGMLDTVPQDWAAGTAVWFFSVNSNMADFITRAALDTVDYKVLPITSNGMLDESDASPLAVTLNERPYLPLRPANVQVNGVGFSVSQIDLTGIDPVPLTWADRNRLAENSQILGWTDAGVSPEAGQTVTITVEQTDGTVLVTHSGLTGGSYDLAASELGAASKVIRFASERDGYASLQSFTLPITLSFYDEDTAAWVAAA